MPTFADSNRASLRYVAESTWGVIPTGTESTKLLRFTSSSLVANKETVVSDELRFDRMVSSVPEVAATSSGDINIELSAGSHDDFVAAFLQGTWSTQPNFYFEKGTHVSVATTSTVVISGVDATPYFKSGHKVRLSGFAERANNTYWTLTSDSTFGSGNTTLTMTESTMVVESGSAYTKVEHANDAVVVKNTTVSVSAGAFDGTGVFTSAIAAGELTTGMVIHVDGLGYEEGTVTFSVSAPTDTETITVGDGTNTVIFEVDDNSSVTAGNVAFAPGASVTAAGDNFVAALMNQYLLGNLNVVGTNAAGTVTVRNLNKTGGSLAETGTNIAVGAFANGNLECTGFFTITAAANDSLTVTPDPAASGTVSAGDEVTIKASMVRNPSGEGLSLPHEAITPQSFTMETGFEDVSQYILQSGMRVGTYSVDLSTGSIATGSFSFNGKETARYATDTLNGGDGNGGGASYVTLGSTATEVMNSTTNVGSVKKDGATLSAKLSAISLSGDASLRDQNAIGSKFPEGIGVGRFNLTGSITAYFENGTLYDQFLAHDTVSLAWTMTDLDGNAYVYTIPAVKFTSDPVAPGGIDQDVMEELEWSAFRDSTTKCMLQLDRFSNTNPITSS